MRSDRPGIEYQSLLPAQGESQLCPRTKPHTFQKLLVSYRIKPHVWCFSFNALSCTSFYTNPPRLTLIAFWLYGIPLYGHVHFCHFPRIKVNVFLIFAIADNTAMNILLQICVHEYSWRKIPRKRIAANVFTILILSNCPLQCLH